MSISQLAILKNIENATRQNLSELNLSGLEIEELPPEIGNVSSLTELNLTHNNITNLPPEIGQLNRLKKLYLSWNNITSLPPEIGQLKNLTELSLNWNSLTSLPPEIGQLKNLTELNLSTNELRSLPIEFGQLNKLKKLNLNSNPLDMPPPEIISRGIRAILDYLNQLDTVDHLYEAKLLILGEGGAGKTSLAQKILDSTYQLETEENSTRGIDIYKWGFSLGGGRVFKLNIWDFGGQEIYHATHQFFLTKRSLYVLVADARNEDTDFYYWLNIAELLGGDSPLIIISNEKQDRKRAIDERSLREQFLNLKRVMNVNLATNRGLEDVLLDIQHRIRSLPHVGAKLPRTWIDVRRILEEDPRNYILYSEYIHICNSVNLTKQRYQDQVLGYLHDLGVCLHFEDDDLLKRYVILKPEWGTNAVYKVLDNVQVIENWGEFSSSDLEKIWYEKQYNNMHYELLQLMINFKLCSQIPDTKTYIAPQLLPIEKAEYIWEKSQNLQLRYRYKFMPKGILTRLIVTLFDLIEDQTVWRTGVIITNKDQDTRAEVREYYDEREIRIRLQGSNQKSLLAIIRREIERIHNGFHHLKFDELIPCNCIVCSRESEPAFHFYSRLRDFQNRGIEGSQCGNSGLLVGVQSLIDDVITRVKIGRKTMQFDVFISHSSKDKDEINKIITDLQRMNISYWVDQEQIKPNSRISETIEKGIESSRHLLLCLSSNMIKSGWIRAEYTAMLNPLLSGDSNFSIIVLNLDEASIIDTPALLRDWKQTNYQDSQEYQKLLEFLKE